MRTVRYVGGQSNTTAHPLRRQREQALCTRQHRSSFGALERDWLRVIEITENASPVGRLQIDCRSQQHCETTLPWLHRKIRYAESSAYCEFGVDAVDVAGAAPAGGGGTPIGKMPLHKQTNKQTNKELCSKRGIMKSIMGDDGRDRGRRRGSTRQRFASKRVHQRHKCAISIVRFVVVSMQKKNNT